MALTGLEIFKQLPRTNCKDCGYPTCLAFAMALATGKVGLDLCPHISDTARDVLDSASAPPIALVKIGAGEKQVVLGNETVLFRHDKRFENACAIAVPVSDALSADEIKDRVGAINRLVFDRVGQTHSVNMVLVDFCSGSPERFAEAAKIVAGNTEYPLILKSEDPLPLEKALAVVAANKPLLWGANASNYEAMAGLAQKFETPLVVQGTGLDELADTVEKVTAKGYKQLLIDSGAREISQVLADQTQIRRLALKKRRSFGYPTIVNVTIDDPVQAVLAAAVYISKYAGIVVINSVDPADMLPLITLRLNIYTDPQRPIAVESKVYEVLTPGPDSPVFITTNFSLTYFCVAGDVEASKTPAYILPVDTDGVSVLTGWAADKFTPEKIADMLNNSGIADMVSHRKVIIPGGVAVLGGRLQEVSGWEVLVGPYESSGIPAFIKKHWGS